MRTIYENEKHSQMPWTYQARLERTVQVADPTKGYRSLPSVEKSTITGQVHPYPRNVAEAVECVRIRLEVMLSDGWKIVDLRVSAYGQDG